MDSFAVLMIAAMSIIAIGSTWQQINPVLSASHQRFHYRQNRQNASYGFGSMKAPPSLMAPNYGDEVLGATTTVLGRQLALIPLRLDYHHRRDSQTPDERRIVLCVFWPDIAPQFPDFPFAKVCR